MWANSFIHAVIPRLLKTEKDVYRIHIQNVHKNLQESAQDYTEMESVLAGMLALDPDERFTPEQALQHPFFARSS
jgi:hypothetical protein